MKVYLANPVADKTEGNKIAKELRAIGFDVINPLHFPQHTASSVLVERELHAIERCDILVALITPFARAAHMEVFYAARILRKPTFVIYRTAKDAGRTFHPWYEVLAECFATKEEMYADLRLHFGKWL